MKYALFLAAAAIGISTAAVAAPASPGLVGAVKAAERHAKGQAIEADLDTLRSGRRVYEVDVLTRGTLREVTVDAASGKVLRTSRQRVEGWFWGTDRLTSALRGARPLADLLREAEARSGGKVVDVELDIEGGRARYEVELSTAAGIAGIYLDPQTGRRLAFVVDD